MSEDKEANSGGGGADVIDMISEDTNAISSETKDLVIEAKSSLVILICAILGMSLLSILLSTWLAKTITNTPTSFATIISRYFGFDHNGTEQSLTWWTPIHIKPIIISRNFPSNKSNSTSTSKSTQIPYSDYPRFHMIVLPLLFIGAIVLAAMAYYARVKCTDRGFAWGAVPKIPLGRVDPMTAATTVPATAIKTKEAEEGLDYTIVQGSKEDPVVFAVAETLQPLNEEREPGGIIDEGTQYEIEDIQKVITHISSAPNLQLNDQTVSLSRNDQQHMIELLQRQPLPTISPQHNVSYL